MTRTHTHDIMLASVCAHTRLPARGSLQPACQQVMHGFRHVHVTNTNMTPCQQWFVRHTRHEACGRFRTPPVDESNSCLGWYTASRCDTMRAVSVSTSAEPSHARTPPPQTSQHPLAPALASCIRHGIMYQTWHHVSDMASTYKLVCTVPPDSRDISSLIGYRYTTIHTHTHAVTSIRLLHVLQTTSVFELVSCVSDTVCCDLPLSHNCNVRYIDKEI